MVDLLGRLVCPSLAIPAPIQDSLHQLWDNLGTLGMRHRQDSVQRRLGSRRGSSENQGAQEGKQHSLHQAERLATRLSPGCPRVAACCIFGIGCSARTRGLGMKGRSSRHSSWLAWDSCLLPCLPSGNTETGTRSRWDPCCWALASSFRISDTPRSLRTADPGTLDNTSLQCAASLCCRH